MLFGLQALGAACKALKSHGLIGLSPGKSVVLAFDLLLAGMDLLNEVKCER